MNPRPKAIFLMGPTASGKTDFALELLEHLPVEIISVDSAMVYRGMDIGTGKPSKEILKNIPHHLIDIRDPKDPYSAADFASDANQLMNDIIERGKIPLLVGGTLLYFRALENGLSPLPAADPEIRKKLLEEGNRVGWAEMHKRLEMIDPVSAKRIHPNDPQRIQRALEVYEITNKTMTEIFLSPPHPIPLPQGGEGIAQSTLSERPKEITLSNFSVHKFAIIPPDRTILHQKIEQRFHQMLEQGLIKEVEKLYHRKNLDLSPELTSDLPSIRSVGYRQIWNYLAGEYDYEQMVYKSIVATRQLAKRQLTWLNSLTNINLLDNNHRASLKNVINCLT